MKVLILDGHPDENRLLCHLLDHYQMSLDSEINVVRINVRDLEFTPNLKQGFGADQTHEPDLVRVADAIAECDHIVVGFPLWWGAEPAMLKGLLDRVLLPGFAFKYHRENIWWDKLLTGRSADLIVTMDTPPWLLRFFYLDPVMRRWRIQVFGFTGVKPMRAFRFGTTRRGGAAKGIAGWEKRLERAAKSIVGLKRGTKFTPVLSNANVVEALKDRNS